MSVIESPLAHLHVVGMLRFMSEINQPSLLTLFDCVLVPISVYIALSSVFHSVNSHDNSPQSDSVLPDLFPPFSYIFLYESLLQS